MNLPGLLIEYLITGVISILGGWWLLGQISPDRVLRLTDLNAGHAAIGGPAAYVIGMCVDYLSRRLTDTLEAILRKLPKWPSRPSSPMPLDKLAARHPDDPTLLTKADIVARSTELGRQLEIRKSRDRIARGVFANAVFLSMGGLFAGAQLPTTLTVWCTGSALVILITYKIWRRMEGLSHRYRVLASDALSEIAKRGRPANVAHPQTTSDARLPIAAAAIQQTVSRSEVIVQANVEDANSPRT